MTARDISECKAIKTQREKSLFDRSVQSSKRFYGFYYRQRDTLKPRRSLIYQNSYENRKINKTTFQNKLTLPFCQLCDKQQDEHILNLQKAA